MWPTRPPPFGPIILGARALAGVVVPAQGQFPAATEKPAVYRWPFAAFCTGMCLVPLSGSAADLANVSLRFQDETAYDVFSDGGGQNFEQGGLSMVGRGLGNYQALQRPIADGDEWLFTLFNGSGADITIAGLFFAFMRPGPESETA